MSFSDKPGLENMRDYTTGLAHAWLEIAGIRDSAIPKWFASNPESHFFKLNPESKIPIFPSWIPNPDLKSLNISSVKESFDKSTYSTA